MPDVMITGATGFVGRHLVQQVNASSDYKIHLAVRSEGAVSSFATDTKIHQINTIDADTDWTSALTGCDTVIHLAARVHVMQERAASPIHEFRKVNVDGTLNLARQAVNLGVKRFIYLSSIKVNGEKTTRHAAFRPDDAPNPDDPYAISKYEAEQGLMALAAKTGLEVVIIRPPLIYGPGVKGNFQRMMKWLAHGIPLPLGSVDNKRSFVSVDNLNSLIIQCITHPKAANQVFLVSDDHDLSITELLRKIGPGLGKPARLLPFPYRILNLIATLLGKKSIIQRLCGTLQVDISKTRELLGWKPVISSDDALRITAEHYVGKE